MLEPSMHDFPSLASVRGGKTVRVRVAVMLLAIRLNYTAQVSRFWVTDFTENNEVGSAYTSNITLGEAVLPYNRVMQVDVFTNKLEAFVQQYEQVRAERFHDSPEFTNVSPLGIFLSMELRLKEWQGALEGKVNLLHVIDRDRYDGHDALGRVTALWRGFFQHAERSFVEANRNLLAKGIPESFWTEAGIPLGAALAGALASESSDARPQWKAETPASIPDAPFDHRYEADFAPSEDEGSHLGEGNSLVRDQLRETASFALRGGTMIAHGLSEYSRMEGIDTRGYTSHSRVLSLANPLFTGNEPFVEAAYLSPLGHNHEGGFSKATLLYSGERQETPVTDAGLQPQRAGNRSGIPPAVTLSQRQDTANSNVPPFSSLYYPVRYLNTNSDRLQRRLYYPVKGRLLGVHPGSADMICPKRYAYNEQTRLYEGHDPLARGLELVFTDVEHASHEGRIDNLWVTIPGGDLMAFFQVPSLEHLYTSKALLQERLEILGRPEAPPFEFYVRLEDVQVGERAIPRWVLKPVTIEALIAQGL